MLLFKAGDLSCDIYEYYIVYICESNKGPKRLIVNIEHIRLEITSIYSNTTITTNFQRGTHRFLEILADVIITKYEVIG